MHQRRLASLLRVPARDQARCPLPEEMLLANACFGFVFRRVLYPKNHPSHQRKNQAAFGRYVGVLVKPFAVWERLLATKLGNQVLTNILNWYDNIAPIAPRRSQIAQEKSCLPKACVSFKFHMLGKKHARKIQIFTHVPQQCRCILTPAKPERMSLDRSTCCRFGPHTCQKRYAF